ncbi:hypothetical protein [Litorisediminicola beolgyonensis]|uniref:Uncharacterized protein n=1 Tax=Litorisediminicola beolgyonensis TaxID=1173614 RepID=A0ABW3ZGE2_9RHOB
MTGLVAFLAAFEVQPKHLDGLPHVIGWLVLCALAAAVWALIEWDLRRRRTSRRDEDDADEP